MHKKHRTQQMNMKTTIVSSLKLQALTLVSALTLVGASAQAQIPSYAPIDLLGRGLATSLNKEMQDSIQAFGRDGIFLGITGTLKPWANVSYNSGSLKEVCVHGQRGAGAEFRIEVVASAKLDALGGPFTTKIAKVTTRQSLVIRVLPEVRDGVLGVTGQAEIVGQPTAEKERQAKQSQADSFRDKIRAELLGRINERLVFAKIN
jgi:hypothetical protein